MTPHRVTLLRVRKLRQWLRASAVAPALLACGAVDGRSGADQPFLVNGGQFFPGALPGTPPLAAGSSDAPTPPTTTSATSSAAYLRERLADVAFSGLAAREAVAVATRIEGFGDGYWVVPTGFPDPQSDGRVTWDFTASFGAGLVPGRHRLLTVAVDDEGRAGTQAATSLCIHSLAPDNGNSCFPKVAPPTLVISLEWDTAVDLDLVVVTPSGETIHAGHPSAGFEEGSSVASPGVGSLKHDTNSDCAVDGLGREDVVFEERPPAGLYSVYASLARTCGESSVTYSASYQVRKALAGEEFGVQSTALGAGTLLAAQAKPGTLGTFIDEVTVR